MGTVTLNNTAMEGVSSSQLLWNPVTEAWDQKQQGTLGSAHSRLIAGTGETTKSRYRPAVTSSSTGVPVFNTATWTSTDNVTEVTISAQNTTDEPAQSDTTGVLVVFDALNDAVAKALLDDTGSATADVQLHYIPSGGKRTFTGTSYFSRADFKAITNTCRVIVEAQ